MSKIRQQRTAERIRLILSELVLRETRDPRLQALTFTDVTIDRELQYADVYVNALGDESREEEVLAALQGATGYFRSELASRMRLRTVPQLHFHWDPSLAHAERVNEILDSLDIPPASAEEE
ncbi:MAG: 30S ribosome-binding factor RbfA [Candidatus Promineifilaceae bacterium]|nr:30S ribosome-binding factor RbfA [Candidatus Promineifilaceae bacterium]